MEENQNGQLNNSNNQSATTSGQGGSLSTQNTGVSNSGVAGNIVGNDTAAVGTGGVVSLKGGQTQREIDEQRKIEELKSRAVKLERKLTPREKELERMHEEAVKPSTFVPQQGRKIKTLTPDRSNGLTKNGQVIPSQAAGRREQNLAAPKVDAKKQEELVENLINPIEAPRVVNKAITKQEVAKPIVPTPAVRKEPIKQEIVKPIKPIVPTPAVKKEEIKQGEIEKKNTPPEATVGKQVKKAVEQKPVKRMVISPAGQISYVDNQKTEKTIVKDEKKTVAEKNTTKDNNSKASASSNIINLKSEEKKSEGKRMDAGSMAVKSKNIPKTPKIPKVPETPWEEKKVDLKDLPAEKRIDMQATPSMASINFNMDDDFNKEVVEWFDKYNELPVNIKLGLGSAEVRQAIKDLATKNNLMKEGFLGELSRIVRDVYVKLIKAEDIKKRLSTVLKLKEDVSEVIIKEIGGIVGIVKEVGNKKSNEYFDKLSLKDALEKYPNIATEEITAGRINDKQSDKYVDSTVQNWMNDYINQMGSNKHTNLERGKYLNDSVNTKNLDAGDKKIIEKLTKSYDEDSKLIVDREEGVILWGMHDDESRLGINSDKNKRVINRFKIEEAQTADVDKDKSVAGLSLKKSSPKIDTSKSKSNLENSTDNSIMNSSRLATSEVSDVGTKFVEKKQGDDNDLLDLSSEIPVRK